MTNDFSLVVLLGQLEQQCKLKDTMAVDFMNNKSLILMIEKNILDLRYNIALMKKNKLETVKDIKI